MSVLRHLSIAIIVVALSFSSTALGESDIVIEDMSSEEMDDRGREDLDEMRRVLSRVLELHQQARESRDVVKLNCVNEKLIAIKGLLKISEGAYNLLQEKIVQNKLSAAKHEYRKISIAKRNCTELAGESETCVGEFAVYSGDTDIEVEIDADVVGSDDFALGDSGGTWSGEAGGGLEDLLDLTEEPIEPPPAASPFQ